MTLGSESPELNEYYENMIDDEESLDKLMAFMDRTDGWITDFTQQTNFKERFRGIIETTISEAEDQLMKSLKEIIFSKMGLRIRRNGEIDLDDDSEISQGLRVVASKQATALSQIVIDSAKDVDIPEDDKEAMARSGRVRYRRDLEEAVLDTIKKEVSSKAQKDGEKIATLLIGKAFGDDEYQEVRDRLIQQAAKNSMDNL